MRKKFNILLIIVMFFCLTGCEQGLNNKCNHQWDEGIIEKIDGQAFKKYTCVICETSKTEDLGLPIIVDKYVIDVVSGYEYIYGSLDVAYEAGKTVELRLIPNQTLTYTVKINGEEIENTEYKDLYIVYEFTMPQTDVELAITAEQSKRIFDGVFPPIAITKNPNETFVQSLPLEIDYNYLRFDDGSELLIHAKKVETNFFEFLNDHIIMKDDYSRVFELIKKQTNIYVASQDVENIPCYQGAYYNVYYFVIVEGRKYYIPTVQNIDSNEIISTAVYLLADDPHRSAGSSNTNYFTLAKVEEKSDCIYVIKNYEEFLEFNNKYYNHLSNNVSYSVYKLKYDESYFKNSYLIICLVDEEHSNSFGYISSSISSNSVLSYNYKIKTEGTDKKPSTLLTLIEKSNIFLDQLKRVDFDYSKLKYISVSLQEE